MQVIQHHKITIESQNKATYKPVPWLWSWTSFTWKKEVTQPQTASPI